MQGERITPESKSYSWRVVPGREDKMVPEPWQFLWQPADKPEPGWTPGTPGHNKITAKAEVAQKVHYLWEDEVVSVTWTIFPISGTCWDVILLCFVKLLQCFVLWFVGLGFFKWSLMLKAICRTGIMQSWILNDDKYFKEKGSHVGFAMNSPSTLSRSAGRC